MDFTGERFTPECVREIWYEHWHRYAFALEFARDCRVLDLACGEGYGSSLLASVARHVTGVDVSREAVEHAREHYRLDTLEFLEGDATAIPLEDGSVDLVVSFETIEHLEPQDRMLAEFRRVLSEDGLLIISSPDKSVYGEGGEENPFHVRELERREFEALLSRHFPAHRLLGQKLAFASMIWSEKEAPRRVNWLEMDEGEQLRDRPGTPPVYLIALCATRPDLLPDLSARMSLFSDRSESVYQHYHHEIRKNMSAGALLQQRDARIAELETQVERLSVERGGKRPGLFRRLFRKSEDAE